MMFGDLNPAQYPLVVWLSVCPSCFSTQGHTVHCGGITGERVSEMGQWMWRIIYADLKLSRDPPSFRGWVGVEKTLGDGFKNASCCWGRGRVSGLELVCSSVWGLMKTNDLTRSEVRDQGWRISSPSPFPSWEINEAAARLVRRAAISQYHFLPKASKPYGSSVQPTCWPI